MFKFCLVIFLSIFCSFFYEQIVLAQTVNPDNGLEAYNGVFTFATYIEVLDDVTLDYQSECFGNLIDQSWVFVPAICLSSIHNTYRLHFGDVNFTQAEISMVSRQSFIHPEYNPSSIRTYNGGLIQLPTPLTFTGTISPVKLPFNINDEMFIGTKAYFVGRRNIVDPRKYIKIVFLRQNGLIKFSL